MSNSSIEETGGWMLEVGSWIFKNLLRMFSNNSYYLPSSGSEIQPPTPNR